MHHIHLLHRNKLSLHSAVLIAMGVLALFPTKSHGELILSDDFTVSMNVNVQPNFEIGSRQAGSAATSDYTVLTIDPGNNGIQLGNSTTDVGQPGGTSNSNFMLLAFNSSLQNDLVFDAALAAGKPIQIAVDVYTGTNLSNDDWVALTLRAPGNAWPIAGSGEFGMLSRGTQAASFFANNGEYGNVPVGTVYSSLWFLTFSDAAGTGSPFADNGTRVVIKNGDTVLSDTVLASEFGSSGSLRLGFYAQSTMIGGIDNLVITSVPEPASIPYLVVAGCGVIIALRKRLRRRSGSRKSFPLAAGVSE